MSPEHADGAAPEAPKQTTGRVRRGWVILLFLHLWLMVAFATGTLTLIGPTRWVKYELGLHHLAAWENQAMWIVILLFVAGSFLLARWLHGRALRSPRRMVRAGIPLTATGLAALAFAGWMDPARLSALAGGTERQLNLESGAEFVFGPYPDAKRLAQLKAQGFTAVISLQHPAVVPLEPQGIAAERESAAQIGIEFIHAPMLPWVSDNTESLARIRAIAETRTGKFYVHCGLGRDRANIVRAVLERMGTARIAASPELKPARTFGDRVREGRWLMERGNFQVLEESLWLVPWPNEKEGFGKMLAGQIEHVTVVMDTTDAEQAGWVREARELFGGYGVPYTIVDGRVENSQSLQHAARAVHDGPRPAVVLVPRTIPCPDARTAAAFLEAWERAGGIPAARVQPGAGDPAAEGRPLPCERARRAGG